MFTRFVLAGSTLCLAGAAIAAPTGHIAGISNGTASVITAANGRIQALPHGQRAWKLAISPQGGITYFVTPAGKPVNTPDNAKTPCVGRGTVGTYDADWLLSRPLQGIIPNNLQWNPSGTALWFSDANGRDRVFTVQTGVVSSISRRPDDVSRSGRVSVFSDDKAIWVRDARGRQRIIFTISKPQPLFDALKSGRNPKGVRDLVDAVDPELWKQPNNWTLSRAALAPDGSRVYFAANAGTGMGAAGNTTYCVFAYDLVKNRLDVLSTLGALFGRSPDTFDVSPDGKRLLIASSVHSSAAENPYFVLVVDLLTQKSRELLTNLPEAKGNANLLDSLAWSPDSRYVALSAYFYNVEALIQRNGDWEEPRDQDWRLFIQDAATGKTIRRLKGVRELSWGR